ncbi:hypothetical protein GYMLUDRAFT_262674 [Collybiopsis luxurians FD-317 M1]|uniref:Uncharacterized protein n=1 Tax=Collybiopsis luxurians FD-317 M1 TaxID=944289 RepID=A0A0D0B477_9AGAR|nr:hypothetical protein GYMLUDRAFT_262674 [Collybiopsis luxurians FD-317 M1]
MADIVLLYRAYTLWDRRVVIVIGPFVLLVSSIVAGLYGLVLASKGAINTDFLAANTDFFAANAMLKDSEIGKEIFAGCTLFTNLILTGLIVYRVRQRTQITNKYLPSSEHVKNKNLIKLITGSCLLYSMALVATYGEAIGGGANPFVAPILAEMMGISPTFMIVEIDLILYSPINGTEQQGEA